MTKFKLGNPKGFTLIELMIVVAILGILGGVLFNAITGKGVSEKAQCLQSGGQWTEGIQYGRYTALCAFGTKPGN